VVVPDGAIRLSAGNELLLLPIVVAATVIAVACGNGNCNNWQLEINHPGLPFPGTSKCNKIEHRLFCQITTNWRARPLISREVVVNLIANTTTKTGLKELLLTKVNTQSELKLLTNNCTQSTLNETNFTVELQNLSQSNSIVDQIILASLPCLSSAAG